MGQREDLATGLESSINTLRRDGDQLREGWGRYEVQRALNCERGEKCEFG